MSVNCCARHTQVVGKWASALAIDNDWIRYVNGPPKLGLAVKADNAAVLRCTQTYT